jgi:hypothetical protein
MQTPANCKVTISLPCDVLGFADMQSKKHGTSRSQFIAHLLEQARAREEERLAAEGYRFYSGEASEFASASNRAAAEAWESNGQEG